MKRFVASLLVLLLLAGLFGVPSMQAAPDKHGAPTAYSQESAGNHTEDSPACSHACHVASHFVALPMIALDVSVPADEQHLMHGDAAVFSAPVAAPFHPPRALD